MDYEGNTNAPGGEYDVFLSFCGGDTPKGFTDYLYHDLDFAGIRTFRDNEGLHVGEQIGPQLEKAIKESKISIPIFSKNYASRKWCLRELFQMVECQKEPMGRKIIPIFYDVHPDDVKHQTGSYAEAFRQHTADFDENTIKEWRGALSKVGQLKGLEFEKETNGHQGKLVKKVVSMVCSELKKNHMTVTDNLVGIDHHVTEMMGLLDVDSTDVRIVGIHGMSGIGKTTIAKVIYNQLSKYFEFCCFLENVRERSQPYNGFVRLQNEIINKILKGKYLEIVNDDDGINRIRDIVCTKRVLIVFDDVDKKSHFDKLAGNFVSSGTRIIVTTRNKEVLDMIGVDKIYEPLCMEFGQSLQLFSKLAFGMDSPQEDFKSLSKEVVSTAAGLPLALEKIGSFLSGKEKDVWEDKLKELKNRPDKEVHEQLETSYRI